MLLAFVLVSNNSTVLVNSDKVICVMEPYPGNHEICRLVMQGSTENGKAIEIDVKETLDSVKLRLKKGRFFL